MILFAYLFLAPHLSKQDWRWFHSSVPARIRDLQKAGHDIVIFSNQKGLSLKPTRVKEFKKRIGYILEELNVDLVLYAATEDDSYRKPCTGMWESHSKLCKGISLEESFFVGDAAGRPDFWKPKAKKDFSDTDRKFAKNIGLAYHTPEEFFLNEPRSEFALTFDPASLIESAHTGHVMKFVAIEKEILVLMGPPASGYRHFACSFRD